MELCIQCKATSSSYKCPKCRSRYCSIACYKEHKIVCVGKDNVLPVKSSKDTTVELFENKSDNFILSETLKQKLANSFEIRNILKSSKLQLLIRSIDELPDSERTSKLRKIRVVDSEFEDFARLLLDTLK